MIISNLKGKIICLYQNIYENCYFENKFIKVKKSSYLDKKLNNFDVPFEDNSFYYFIPNENNVKNVECLILEENLNLLDKRSIIKIMKILNITNFKILEHKFLIFKSNLILIINKKNVE